MAKRAFTSFIVLFLSITTAVITIASPKSVYATAGSTGSPCTCTVVENGVKVTKEGQTMKGAILQDICDCGGGEGVMAILNIVVNIFTVAIGILAAVGIAITGTQYLTAGPNEEKTRKAKRRLIEIVIGVAAYVLIYSLLVWLLPGFNGFGG